MCVFRVGGRGGMIERNNKKDGERKSWEREREKREWRVQAGRKKEEWLRRVCGGGLMVGEG